MKKSKGITPFDVLGFIVVFAIFYFLIRGRAIYGVVPAKGETILSLKLLPLYALYSVGRVFIAFILSFIFALIYGYIAAKNRFLEVFLIPLLDVLQSIPVLSFLPPVLFFMVSLFHGSRVGLELGSIILIFTGQVWNLVFSFYNSLKTIPRELDEAAKLSRLNFWQRFTRLELPHAAIGLIWNSMLSVAGGWFFLMACETFTLLNKKFSLPGLGSFLAKSAESGNIKMTIWGIVTLALVIVLIDQLLWRPLIAWSTKFKMEEKGEEEIHSAILNLYRRSKILEFISSKLIVPLNERIERFFDEIERRRESFTMELIKKLISYIFSGLIFLLIIVGAKGLFSILAKVSISDWIEIVKGGFFTLLRVVAAVSIGYLWTIPVGVKIGMNPKISKVAQPVVQIIASIPATAIFPILLMFLIKIGGGLSFASILLMLLSTQWYILFNVMGGASGIPKNFVEAGKIFRIKGVHWWRIIVIPSIFSFLVTGGITAWGAAFNASIVSEYVKFSGKTFMIPGLGAIITSATERGDMPLLTSATLFMALIVVIFNRLFWRRMYKLSEEKFHVE